MSNKKKLPPTYLISAIIFMGAVHFIVPVTKIIVFPWNFLGFVPLVMGVIFNLMADGAFKKVGTTVKPFEESTVLVKSGVFRLSRHPMYLGMVFILIGIAIFMGSLTPYFVVLLFAVSMKIVFIRAEERMLEEKFGDDWFEYKGKVRRWI